MACSFVSSPATVRDGLAALLDRTGADELIFAAAAHDHASGLRSYELLANAFA